MHVQKRLVSPALFAALVAVVSCLPGARAPEVTPTRTLELAGEPPPSSPSHAFAVVFASPTGTQVEASEVTIVFNRAMHPFEIAGQESTPPATLVMRGTDRAPPGSWRWMGTSALVFAPDPALPAATEYVATVPAGTHAMSGEALAAPYVFTFATPAPRLVRSEPSEGSDHLAPETTFQLGFNQRVEPREVERATTLTVGEGKEARKIAVRASRPKPDDEKLVKLVPASPLPLASRLRLVVDDTLRGLEGTVPSGKKEELKLATYGPLTARVRCYGKEGHCGPWESFQLELSNGARYDAVKAHVRVDPAAPIGWTRELSGDSQDSSYSIPARTRPGTTYRITVTAGLRDEYGQTLAHDSVTTLAVDDLDPNVVIGVRGNVAEALPGTARIVPVASVNIDHYTLATGALDEPTLAGLLAEYAHHAASTMLDTVSRAPSVKVETVSSSAPRNARFVKNVPIAPLLAGRGGHGAVVLATESETSFVGVTDLGISAKMSRFGSVAWVTRLSDGKPVPGATVSVFDEHGSIFDTRTDSDGIAPIPADAYAPADADGQVDTTRIVVARLGDDWTWRRPQDAATWGGRDAWVDVAGGLEPMGMLFTDRGVYRPGETIKLQGIFRTPTPRGTETPAGRAIDVKATDGEGNAVFEGHATLDPFGEATLDVPVPATAHLGGAEIRASFPGAGNRFEGTSTVVQLAAYKASEFEVHVDPAAKSWIHGEEARFDVRGDYLFGAPMPTAPARWTVTRAQASFTPPGAADFVANDDAFQRELPDTAPRGGEVQSGNGALDPSGALAVRAPLALPGQRGAESVTLEAEVTDVTRQSSAARASVIVHPAAFYVALKSPSDWFVSANDPVRAEVAALDPGGQRRAGVAVHVELVRRTWKSVVESGADSRGHWESTPVNTTVGACEVTTAADPVPCAISANQPGYYFVHASARDDKGRSVAASYDVYVLGDTGDASWRMGDSGELPLVPDKKSYAVGDVARVLVKSPFREAEALVTVERTGVYRQQRVHLVGPTPTVSVPVTDDMRPNVFVGVELVRGRTKAAPATGVDVGAPAYKSGYARIVVDPESRRLKVALTTSKKELRPGDTVDVDVAVTDRAGKPAASELTMWAVDEGVLMLTGYKTPDPLPAFTGPRPLAVFGLESRADLARFFRPDVGQVGVDKGDPGGGGGEPMRADFRATAWFQPSIVTGEDGRAHARFKLPDNLTTFRVMAVAVARDDRFGAADTQVTTSRPLMLRPALPRFLRAGDSMDAGVVVTSKEKHDARVEVTLAADGVIVGADPTRAVDVKAGTSVEVRWPMAAERGGKAKLSFRARGGGESDAVEVTRRVDVPAVLEAVALDGETREAAAEKLGALGAIRDDVGQLDVRLASTALVGVGDGMDQLIEYPYGCTEQLTSRLVPLVAVRRLANDFGVSLGKDPDGMADAAVAKVLANQRGDGGFGYWPDSRKSDPWVTAYALWGLDIAKKGGRTVPADAMDRAAGWLRGELGRLAALDAVGLAATTFAVDVLATMGKPDPGFTNRVYDRRAELPLFARALLAHAIAVSNMDASQSAELMRDLDAHLRVTPTQAIVVANLGDEYAPILDSEPRTTAMALRALVAMNPKHALLTKLSRGLLATRDRGRWESTQEAAWALIALDDYRRAVETDTPDFDGRVWLSGELALEAPFRGRSAIARDAQLPVAKLLAAKQPTIAFQVDGTGDLFYEARLRYARKEMPRDDLDRGFFVRKLVRGVAPADLKKALGTLPGESQARVAAGDLVLVDLIVVTTTPREQVVVDDPLPAGLEPVDTTLETTARSLDVADAGGQGEDDDAAESGDDARAAGHAWSYAWFHREMHDDRVLTFVEHMPVGMFHYRYLARATTPGKFVVPPTRAECMYQPEVFGRTGATALEVKAP
jgi:uncharacterized protein YfaS (alpha-2-macroglobulin family)